MKSGGKSFALGLSNAKVPHLVSIEKPLFLFEFILIFEFFKEMVNLSIASVKAAVFSRFSV